MFLEPLDHLLWHSTLPVVMTPKHVQYMPKSLPSFRVVSFYSSIYLEVKHSFLISLKKKKNMIIIGDFHRTKMKLRGEGATLSHLSLKFFQHNLPYTMLQYEIVKVTDLQGSISEKKFRG